MDLVCFVLYQMLAMLLHPVLCGRMQGCTAQLSKLQKRPPRLQTNVAQRTWGNTGEPRGGFTLLFVL